MYNERSDSDRFGSLQYCYSHYGRHGLFATLPLRAAVQATQIYNTHSQDPSLAEFINSLTYEDSDYFTVEETRFLLKLLGDCTPVSEQQLEADRKILS